MKIGDARISTDEQSLALQRDELTAAGCAQVFEDRGIVERVNVGIASAKTRGEHVGRPRKLTPEQIAHARETIDDGLQTPAGMAGLLGVDHSTLWRLMRRLEANANGR